jgi:hypothetical protein
MNANEVTPPRDNSQEAIVERYNKANRLAIASHNRVMFDSIRDVFYLLAKNQELEKELKFYRVADKVLEDHKETFIALAKSEAEDKAKELVDRLNAEEDKILTEFNPNEN